MIDKPKRKNNELTLTRYDRVWLYQLYRWGKVAKMRHIHVALSPKICLERLKPIEDKRKIQHSETYIRNIEVLAPDSEVGYEFQAQINGPRDYHQTNVNGLIVDDSYGQSFVTLRTYPAPVTWR